MRFWIYAVNSVLMFLIVLFEYNSHNDKSIIISFLGSGILLTVNLILGFLAQLDKKSTYKHFYFSALGVLVCGVILLSMI